MVQEDVPEGLPLACTVEEGTVLAVQDLTGLEIEGRVVSVQIRTAHE